MPVDTTAGAAVLEIERFEWTSPDRIEIAGYWSGLRARRFMRPTLVLKGDGTEVKRLLATLDHKPWSADEGEEWVAAFAWNGEPRKFDGAELSVAPGIDVELPAPRLTPGKRRFRHKAVARDATRDVPAPRATGIVSDAPRKANKATPEPTVAMDAVDHPDATARLDTKPAKAAAPAADPPEVPTPDPQPDLDPAPDPPEIPAPDPDVEPAEPVPGRIEKPDADPTTPDGDPVAPDPVTEPAPDGDSADAVAAIDPAELAAARADADRLRKERDAFRRDVDAANEKVRSIRAELERERQGRERAVAESRAAERESAGKMLAEGAALRAAVERQREIAYLERDDAKRERDQAVEARDRACAERDEAIHARKQAERERKEAFAQRDRAVKIQQRAEDERGNAIVERDEAVAERDDAVKERDEILSVHERGLPVKQPKPRYLPEDEQPRSDLEVWMPRGVAVGILLIFAFIVLRLLAGA